MKRTIINYGILTAVNLLLVRPCIGGTFFMMMLARDAIYTPEEIRLTLGLTEKARIEGEYEFRVHVYMAGVLVRKQVLPATKTESVHFELTFPPIPDKTDVRCRVDLFINGQFIEAGELPMTLFPAPEPYPKMQTDKTIWVFDTSGRLQRIFEDLEVEAVDATFQSARDFDTPEIVFIGENLDPNNMRIIDDRLAMSQGKPVTIFLRQKKLPIESLMEIPDDDGSPQNVEIAFNSRLLSGLGTRDLMNLVNGAVHIRIRRDKRGLVNSYITEFTQDKKQLLSYFFTLEEERRITIFCQLRVIDDKDPRCGILLRNLLDFAYEVSGFQEKKDLGLTEKTYGKAK